MFKNLRKCIGLPASEQPGTESNGYTRSPPRPQESNIFLLPRKLSPFDTVTIEGKLRDNPSKITASLVTTTNDYPDYQNIACQLELYFPSSIENQNQILVKIIKDGITTVIRNDENITTAFVTGSSCSVSFIVRSGNGSLVMDIEVCGQYLEQIMLKHNANIIRYLDMAGDIEGSISLSYLHYIKN